MESFCFRIISVRDVVYLWLLMVECLFSIRKVIDLDFRIVNIFSFFI